MNEYTSTEKNKSIIFFENAYDNYCEDNENNYEENIYAQDIYTEEDYINDITSIFRDKGGDRSV